MDSVYVLITVFVLVLLVMLHELGHFAAAKSVNAAVHTLSLGFGKVITWVTGPSGTRFALSLVPLGGYVRLLQEDEDNEETKAIKGVRYERISVWKRAWIASAGCLANLLVAVLLLWVLAMTARVELRPVIGAVAADSVAAQVGLAQGDEIYQIGDKQIRTFGELRGTVENMDSADEPVSMWARSADGQEREHPLSLNLPETWDAWGLNLPLSEIPPKIISVEDTTPAAQAGLQAGDELLRFNGETVGSWSQWGKSLRANPGMLATITYLREGEERVTENLILGSRADQEGRLQGFLGVRAADQWPQELYISIDHGVFGALSEAFTQTGVLTKILVSGYIGLFSGNFSLSEISGPIGIVSMGAESAALGLKGILWFSAIISLALMVFNLLPIPGLDGGTLVILGVEQFRGKPVAKSMHALWTLCGFVLLGILVSLAIFNDIVRL